MKRPNFSLVILLFIGITNAQPQVIIQSEELNIAKIEAKAIVDARTDFDRSKRLTWAGGSALSGFLSLFVTWSGLEEYTAVRVPIGLALVSAPFIASKIIDVDFPKTRTMELAFEIQSERYRSVYRSKYISEIKKLRLTNSLISPAVFLVTGLGWFVWLFVLGGVAS